MDFAGFKTMEELLRHYRDDSRLESPKWVSAIKKLPNDEQIELLVYMIERLTVRILLLEDGRPPANPEQRTLQ